MTSTLTVGVILISIIVPQHSKGLSTDSYLIHSDVDCFNDYAYEGRFHFLDDKAEAFWHLESDNVYFEYYFPVSRWIGIAASNQHCVDCHQQNQDVSDCLESCVGNNLFVATSKGDSDPQLAWNILEFEVNPQYQMKELRSVWGLAGQSRMNASFFLEKVDMDGMQYIHGAWRRELEPWMRFDDVCWTTIASMDGNPNARSSEFGYFMDKESAEIHCNIGQKRICNKEEEIPHLGIQITEDVCEDKNLSLVILMDASMSISDYFDVSKSWISDLLQQTAELLDYENDKRSLEGGQNALGLRTALILFDHSAQLIWNLDYFDAYDHEKATSMITEAMERNEMQRLSGTHIRDVLQYAVDHVFALMKPSDTNLVLMLSDGKPSSCYGAIDQNPCQIAPNPISKAFEEAQVQFLAVAVGDEDGQSLVRMSSVFECLSQDMKSMRNSIIVSPSYLDLGATSRSVHSYHTCGLDPQHYECDVQMYRDGEAQMYSYDWNYASYTFTVAHHADIWPYYATIKVQPECDDPVELHAKLMHFDPLSQQTSLVKEADQVVTLSSGHSEYKFSFRGSAIDRSTGKTAFDALEVGETYVIQFYVVDNDAKCKGTSKLPVVGIAQMDEYYKLDKYLVDVSSSIAWVGDKDHAHVPGRNAHPLVKLCIAERLVEAHQNTRTPRTTFETSEATKPTHTTHEKTELKTTATAWPTKDYPEDKDTSFNHCQSPKYFASPVDWNRCDEDSVEWNVDFKNWFYNVHEDTTYVEYEICVLGVPPFRPCPFMSHHSGAMSMVMFQIPCFCEVCLNSMTEYMKPMAGYTTEVHQGWVWEHLVFPGECERLEIALDGYVAMDTGYYKVMGDGRWIEGAIQVPNPCEPAAGYPRDYDNERADEQASSPQSDAICYHDAPMYPDHDCSYICDGYLDNEWRLDYVSTYNEDGNTVFVYNALVESNVDDLECTTQKHSTAQTLSKIYLRLGCDCEYQSVSFLESMTVKMEPFGEVNEDHWLWTLDLKDGDVQELKLVLQGENMEMSYSDMSLVGADRRCTSFNKIKVPNPCVNKCNYGEWSKWSVFGKCSQECGGGYKYKMRQCISICDGVTLIDNCVGQNNHMSPCNTNPCAPQEEH